jgi:chemotaxis protein MotB
VLSGIVSDLFTMDSMVNALTFSDPGVRVENRLAVLSSPACEAYRLLEPYRAGDGAGLGLEIANLGALAAGEDLRLALRLPPDRTNLHIVQFLDEGTIGQLELAARSAAAGVSWSIDTGHATGAPDRQSLVLAVATEAPLFASARPPVEPAEAFLPALRDALARHGAGRSAPLAACAIVAMAAGGDGAAESGPSFC